MQRNIPNEKIQFIKKRSEKSRKIDKILLLIPVVIILIGMIIAIFDIGIRENPAERNYIYFKNDSKENVIDSLKSFRRLISEMNLPKYKDRSFTIFGNREQVFRINNEHFKKLQFNFLRSSRELKNVKDTDLIQFIALYKYLTRNNIEPGKYYYGNSWELYSNYKPYEKKYNTLSYDDDLMRFLLITHNNKVPDFYKILDSYNNVYLVAFRSAEIWEDDVPY